jgi:hypothetical protein
MCMEAMLGITLYRYLYLKLANMLYLSYYLFMFSLQQNQRTRGWNRFCLGGEGAGEVGVEGSGTNNVCTCK